MDSSSTTIYHQTAILCHQCEAILKPQYFVFNRLHLRNELANLHFVLLQSDSWVKDEKNEKKTILDRFRATFTIGKFKVALYPLQVIFLC